MTSTTPMISTLLLQSKSAAARRGILGTCSCTRAAMMMTSMVLASASSLPRPTVFCEQQDNNNKPPEPQFSKLSNKKSFWDELAKTTGNTLQEGLDTGIPANISYSFVCGFCSGYALKKVGRTAAFVFGLGFVTLQTLAYYGYIQVDHARIQKDLESSLMLGKDRAKDRALAIDKMFRILQYQLPAGVGFGTGFVGGIRSG